MARLAMPTVPNTAQLDYSMTQDYGNQIELTHEHELWGKPGAVRALYYQQHAFMGNYQSAVGIAQQNNSTPEITNTRLAAQSSWGYGLNFEQANIQSEKFRSKMRAWLQAKAPDALQYLDD